MLLFFGCKEEEPVQPDRGRSYLHLLGAVEADSFRVTLDYWNADDVVINDYNYLRNFPLRGYADLEAGGTPDEFGNGKLYVTLSKQIFANVTPDTLMDPKELVLNRDEKATLCLVDSFGEYTILKIKDELGQPDADNAQIRFINLSSAHATASLTTDNADFTIGSVPFMQASPFQAVADGQYNLEVRDANGTVVQSLPLFVNGYTSYTFFVSGTTSQRLAYFTH